MLSNDFTLSLTVAKVMKKNSTEFIKYKKIHLTEKKQILLVNFGCVDMESKEKEHCWENTEHTKHKDNITVG